MSDPVADIRSAEARATAARADLGDTLNELQIRLNPKSLARQGVQLASDASQIVARNGANAVRRNTAPIVGVAALGALFLARHRIAALFRRKTPKAKPATRRAPVRRKRRAPSATRSKDTSHG